MSKKTIFGLILLTTILVLGAGGLWYRQTLRRAQRRRETAATRRTESEVVRLDSSSRANAEPPTETTENPSTSSVPEETAPPAQTSPAPSEAVLLAEGGFVELDPVHKGRGTVQAVAQGEQVLLNFQEDVVINDGPDLFVWLVKKQSLGGAVGGVDTDPSTYLNLGPLDDLSGPQSFAVTAEEYAEFNHAVVIWCEAFGVQFTNAVLN